VRPIICGRPARASLAGARTEARTHFAEAQRLAPYLRPPADTTVKDKQ